MPYMGSGTVNDETYDKCSTNARRAAVRKLMMRHVRHEDCVRHMVSQILGRALAPTFHLDSHHFSPILDFVRSERTKCVRV